MNNLYYKQWYLKFSCISVFHFNIFKCNWNCQSRIFLEIISFNTFPFQFALTHEIARNAPSPTQLGYMADRVNNIISRAGSTIFLLRENHSYTYMVHSRVETVRSNSKNFRNFASFCGIIKPCWKYVCVCKFYLAKFSSDWIFLFDMM